MKLLKIAAALAFSLVPLTATAQECDGNYHDASLICPASLTSAAGGGCVHAG